MVVSDSAGVEIVESRAPAWTDATRWRVAAEPAVRIGTASGDPEYQLHGVMATTRLSDGRIVVADAGNSRLRYYDADGRHVADVGREGEGPGEFLYVTRAWRRVGDSVSAFDGGTARVSVFDSAAELVRTVPLTHVDTLGSPSAFDAFADGTMLAISGTGRLSPQEGLIDGAPWFYTRYSSDGEPVNRLGTAMGGDRWGTDHRGGYSFNYLPFELGIPPSAVGAASFYLGQGDRFEVEQRDLDGSLVRILRWSAEPRPVTRDVIDRLVQHRAESAADADERQAIARWVDELPLRSELPRYDEMRVDALGHLWVRRYRSPWEEQPQRWWIFDPDGAWLGELETPAEVRVDEIGEDYVLGVGTDALGVESVVVFSLDRSG